MLPPMLGKPFFGDVVIHSVESFSVGKEQLKDLYNRCLRESDSNRKGRLFEDFAEKFFKATGYFKDIIKRYHAGLTELDLVMHVKQEFVLSYGNIVVVQCKNTKDPLNDNVIQDLKKQSSIFGPLVKIGILATTSKLSKDAKKELEITNRSGTIFIIVIDGDDWNYFFENDISPRDFLEHVKINTPRKYLRP